MKIGIYDGCGFNIRFDETTKFLGGSETWLLEISKAFVALGHEVFLFCNCDFHKYNNITFIPKNKMPEVSKIVSYDMFIWSRGIQHSQYVNAKKKFVILHDWGLTNYNENASLKTMTNIFVLSEWAKEKFQELYGHEYDTQLKITFNGVHNELYQPSSEKENSMIWSSCFERGLDFFIKYVLPKIKKEIPDFKLKICSYAKYANKYDNVIFLGQLSKTQLAKEQCKAKIWCYPNLGYSTNEATLKETFCITAVENALAGNCILTTALGGLGTTCSGLDFLSHEFYNKDDKIYDLEKYGSYLASQCIAALKNEKFTSFNGKKFTWENAAKGFLEC